MTIYYILAVHTGFPDISPSVTARRALQANTQTNTKYHKYRYFILSKITHFSVVFSRFLRYPIHECLNFRNPSKPKKNKLRGLLNDNLKTCNISPYV